MVRWNLRVMEFLLPIPKISVEHTVVLQYIPRNMHTVFALLCFVVVIHWLIFPYPSGLLHWHCGNLTIAPVPAKHPWWIWINTSCEFIMNDCITTTKQSTTKPCAYFLGYTVLEILRIGHSVCCWYNHFDHCVARTLICAGPCWKALFRSTTLAILTILKFNQPKCVLLFNHQWVKTNVEFIYDRDRYLIKTPTGNCFR